LCLEPPWGLGPLPSNGVRFFVFCAGKKLGGSFWVRWEVHVLAVCSWSVLLQAAVVFGDRASVGGSQLCDDVENLFYGAGGRVLPTGRLGFPPPFLLSSRNREG